VSEAQSIPGLRGDEARNPWRVFALRAFGHAQDKRAQLQRRVVLVGSPIDGAIGTVDAILGVF